MRLPNTSALLVLCVLMVAACSQSSDEAPLADTTFDDLVLVTAKGSLPLFRKTDSFAVRFREGTSEQEAREIARRYGLTLPAWASDDLVVNDVTVECPQRDCASHYTRYGTAVRYDASTAERFGNHPAVRYALPGFTGDPQPNTDRGFFLSDEIIVRFKVSTDEGLGALVSMLEKRDGVRWETHHYLGPSTAVLTVPPTARLDPFRLRQHYDQDLSYVLYAEQNWLHYLLDADTPRPDLASPDLSTRSHD